MKLLIYGINYEPELTGIGKYTGEMAAYYAGLGHDVEVITAPPYYPKWKVAKAYLDKGWHTEELNGVTVHRCPLYVPVEQSGSKRIIHEASFLLSSLRYWIPAYFRSYDSIVVVSPPFHLGFPALLHKWLRGTPIINHIQDLQVDAARDLGLLRNKTLLRTLEYLEKFLLRRMTRISTISSGMRKRIIAKDIKAAKLIFFPNWVDDNIVFPVAKDASMRRVWGYLDEDRIVLYSGNLGSKQGLEIVPELAERMAEDPKVHFLIIGEGGVKDELMKQARALNLSRLQFKPLQPLNKLAACLAAADVHLILQKKAAADLVLPSKLTNILAVGGHALITAEAGSTLYDVTAEHRLGTLVDPEDADALENGLRAILNGDRSSDATGAMSYATRYLNKERILVDFLAELNRDLTHRQ